jgi:hypothetical protein
MDFLTHLWLPILLSGVAVWFASALAWMAIGHHKKDRDPIPGASLPHGGEQELMDTITRLNLAPGNYGFPDFNQHDHLPRKARMEKLKALYDRRPYGLLRVWGEMNMGGNMLLTFLFSLFTSAVIAYLGWATLPHGSTTLNTTIVGSGGTITHTTITATFAHVFQVIGTAGILAYCFASFPGDVWFQKKKRAMLMDAIDGIIFGLITAAIFAYFWPK